MRYLYGQNRNAHTHTHTHLSGSMYFIDVTLANMCASVCNQHIDMVVVLAYITLIFAHLIQLTAFQVVLFICCEAKKKKYNHSLNLDIDKKSRGINM